jgi:hypothetical protein
VRQDIGDQVGPFTPSPRRRHDDRRLKPGGASFNGGSCRKDKEGGMTRRSVAFVLVAMMLSAVAAERIWNEHPAVRAEKP